MKKIIFSLMLLFVPFMMVSANTISNIEMDVYIDQNGDAIITETWDAYVNQGTEGYHPYFNVGNSSITMLSASMDGKEYNIINSWNINASLSNKAYKAGIYKTGNEIDLCFGLTSYGNHTYEIKYKISNFVLSLNDADMIYWTLFPYDFSASPNRVYIKLYSDFNYSDTLDVWGYGNYGGTAYIYDGYIEMESNGSLSSSEYMTILVKFPKGTFNTLNSSNNDFNYYYEMAEEGATHYSENTKKSFFEVISIIIASIVTFLINIIIPILIILGLIKKSSNASYNFGTTGKKVRNDVPFFRDIPCNKDIYRAYFVAEKYGLNKKKEDFLGAVLLKWLKNGNIKVEKVEKKQLFKTTEESNIIFVNKPIDIPLETKLYNWMVTASKDGKLESNEFKKWCKNNYSKILNWFTDVLNYQRDILINEGKITIEKTKYLKIKRYVVDSTMMLEAEQMKGLRKYLKEFTLIKEKQPMEVNLWDEYLIYAQIFGMAKQVAEQFKNLYPEITEEMNSLGYSYSDMLFLHSISTVGMNSATTARSRAQSYSSGGGGFSSGGGGGGSFGGGGGGGGFR